MFKFRLLNIKNYMFYEKNLQNILNFKVLYLTQKWSKSVDSFERFGKIIYLCKSTIFCFTCLPLNCKGSIKYRRWKITVFYNKKWWIYRGSRESGPLPQRFKPKFRLVLFFIKIWKHLSPNNLPEKFPKFATDDNRLLTNISR